MTTKQDYDEILTRLTVILTRLNNGENLVVKDLAEEFNVVTRTIQRDFNERLTSFPIILENKKWKMKGDFKIDNPDTIENILILDMLEKTSQNLGDKFFVKAQKLLKQITI